MLVTNTVKKRYQATVEAYFAGGDVCRSIFHVDASSPEEARLLANPRLREIASKYDNLKFINCVVQEAGEG